MLEEHSWTGIVGFYKDFFAQNYLLPQQISIENLQGEAVILSLEPPSVLCSWLIVVKLFVYCICTVQQIYNTLQCTVYIQ